MNTTTCPTCEREASIVLNKQCLDCAEGETRAMIECLQPDGDRS